MSDETPSYASAAAKPGLRADGTTNGHTANGWALSIALFTLIVLYVSFYCGRFADYIPGPLGDLIIRGRDHLSRLTAHDYGRWLLMHLVLGLCIPSVLVWLSRRRLRDVGFAWPNLLGRRLILASVVLSVPFGVYFLFALNLLKSPSMATWPWAIGLVAMLPEHFLICGVTVAVLLPGRRLPEHVPLAKLAGPWWRRGLRWLGLAQPGSSVLGWGGLTAESLMAVTLSGMVFGVVHFGKPTPELILSFPGGMAVAYVTLRSGSIWPAIIAHWSMNLVPVAMILIYHLVP